MRLEVAGICSDTWNIVINVTEHWIGKLRKLEIAKCGMLLGRCYFAVQHKYNTKMLPHVVMYTCYCFYAHKKNLKMRRKPSSKLKIIILVLVTPLSKGKVYSLFSKPHRTREQHNIYQQIYSENLCISVHIWEVWGYMMEDFK